MADGMIKPRNNPKRSILLSGDTYQSIFRPFSSTIIGQDPISNTIRQDLISNPTELSLPDQLAQVGSRTKRRKKKEKKSLYIYENDKSQYLTEPSRFETIHLPFLFVLLASHSQNFV